MNCDTTHLQESPTKKLNTSSQEAAPIRGAFFLVDVLPPLRRAAKWLCYLGISDGPMVGGKSHLSVMLALGTRQSPTPAWFFMLTREDRQYPQEPE